MADFTPRFGYRSNPEATWRFNRTLRIPNISTHLPRLCQSNREKRDVLLMCDVLAVDPNWFRLAQEIGDCVSHGWSYGEDLLVARLVILKWATWIQAWSSQPAFYGLRVEVDSRNFANYEDGWYGSGAAKAASQYGFVPALDWSKHTGNPEHDLRKYSGKIAKEFGRYGCGGKNDNGALDKIAAQRSVKEVAAITTLESAEAVIDRCAPIPVCSDIGFGEMQRDSEGIVRRSGSWAHCMCIAGKIWRKNHRLWRLVQSWGRSCKGPDPYVEEICKSYFSSMGKAVGWSKTRIGDIIPKAIDAISACSWWITDEDMLRILKQNDSYAISGAEGFEMPPWDWSINLFV